MSTRRADTRGEKALARFLDKYFYAKLVNDGTFDSIERVYDASQQKIGIDLIMQKDAIAYKCDEKAQLHYIGQTVDTFVLEIEYFNKDTFSVIDGWFVSDTNVTEKYMFVWVRQAKTDKLYRIVSEDFEELEILEVDKAKIVDYLSKQKLTKRHLLEYSRRIRMGELRENSIHGVGVRLHYSKQLEEQPINLVMEKGILESLCDARYFVTKKMYTNTKNHIID